VLRGLKGKPIQLLALALRVGLHQRDPFDGAVCGVPRILTEGVKNLASRLQRWVVANRNHSPGIVGADAEGHVLFLNSSTTTTIPGASAAPTLNSEHLITLARIARVKRFVSCLESDYVPPLYAEINESVCIENNAIIKTPFNDADKWPDAPVPPPASL
jgi:hypothetical protein